MKKLNPTLLVGSTIAIALSMIGTAISSLGLSEEAIRLALRETARLSLLLFLVIFIASPLQSLSQNKASKWLMLHRRYLGISFGASHLIHLALIVWLILAYSDGGLLNIAPLSSYIVGVIAYAFILVMLITSNNQSIKYLGYKRWKQLHSYGMYVLFFTFFITYAGLLEVDLAFYLPIVIGLIVAALLRISSSFKSTKKVRTA